VAVEPMVRTKRLMRLGSFSSSSACRAVGSVALLEAVEKAVIIAA
jgi:hypothetical protein